MTGQSCKTKDTDVVYTLGVIPSSPEPEQFGQRYLGLRQHEIEGEDYDPLRTDLDATVPSSLSPGL
jgi:hypothetical protein